MTKDVLTLRPEQQDASTRAVEFIHQASPGDKMLFCSATGSGKSRVELDILSKVPGSILITPSMEIVASMLKTLQQPIPKTTTKLRSLALKHGIYTPLWLRNRMLKNDDNLALPTALLWDEVHHQTSDTWSDVSVLAGVPELGFTATPFLGSQRATMKFQEVWGECNWIYTFQDALSRGFVTMPECTTVPLVDDDLVEVVNGEFQVESLESVTRSRLLELANLIKSYPLDQATMVAMPTRALAWELGALIENSVVITGESTSQERQDAFDDMLALRKVLIQINTVGEGVDLPVRRLFDATPTMSPRRWVQLFGRATRPGGKSQYICVCRNLLRHAYALQGVMPVESVLQAQQVFPPSERNGQRAFGLEKIGRFKANPMPLANGLKGEIYLLKNSDKKGTITEYACLLHPLHSNPLWASRVNHNGTYGEWAVTQPPEGFKGFTSGDGSPISLKQRDWWKRAALRYGLDPDHEPNRRTFAALPVLVHTKTALEVS